MRILGIETSCDETAAAVVEVRELGIRNQESGIQVLSNVVASQIKIHAKTGGVVPEVAARAHVEAILPAVEQALKESHPLLNPPPSRGRKNVDIDAIAVTAGPGLMTSLLVGVEVARTLSVLWKKPLIAVNHLAGHIYANWLPPPSPLPRGEGVRRTGEGPMQFPLLCLVVSGGHTELVLMRRHMDFKIIGSTRDDAAGEAFDKVAKMLGLPYPGGPEVSKLAEQYRSVIASEAKHSHTVGDRHGRPRGLPRDDGLMQFPRPMIASPDFDFSFSGLKTSVLYYIKNLPQQNNVRADLKMLSQICYEFQEAAVEVLVAKTIRAAKHYKVKTVLLGGGVAANKRLRQQLVDTINFELPTIDYILPAAEYTGDNAAMIAAAGYFMAQKKQFTPWEKLDVDPNWELGQKFRTLPR